ncbi:Type IV secretory pathway, VirB10 components [Tistlia consotensis]|uniref:Type IV secretory pathway, VirB10 components n=1 Tax=Tistlia consotensis USBA 355 TaxID=560819 RepID=A0A1Y6CQ22_9PROT|nr:TrbI/VirB10 family protein [Tistlia consotensis]SMF81995.1 Type IV secretory pathway, VirB10 components [Tistlia consotensis USBA 355]SNS25027.1 Type IV secretory pathway, VirB10 components [Tistlia consotensis]
MKPVLVVGALLGLAGLAAGAIWLLPGRPPPKAPAELPPLSSRMYQLPDVPEPAPLGARPALHPDALSFAAPGTQQLVLANDGDREVALQRVVAGGDARVIREEASPAAAAGDVRIPAFSVRAGQGCSLIPAGGSCSIDVDYVPAEAGRHEGEIVLLFALPAASVGGSQTTGSGKAQSGRDAAGQEPARRSAPAGAPQPLEAKLAGTYRPAPAPVAPAPAPALPRFDAYSWRYEQPRHDPSMARRYPTDVGSNPLAAGYVDAPSVAGSDPGDRSRLLTTDRSIPATLASGIESEIPGRVLATVDRDVWSADGSRILIPAGSRLVGRHGVLAAQGARRLPIAWERIIRPDGQHLMMSFDTADEAGRAGATGYLDNRFLERFGAALVTSLVGAAVGAGSAVAEGTVEISGQGNTTIVQRDPTAAAAQGAAKGLNDGLKPITDLLVQEAAAIKPILRIPGGTRIIVQPSQDLVLRPLPAASSYPATAIEGRSVDAERW